MSQAKKPRNADHVRRKNAPLVNDEVIEARLKSLLLPAILGQQGYARLLGLRERILSFPVTVAAVVTLLWRQVCEHAYQTTRAELWSRRADLEPLLARYGIALRPDVLTDPERHFDSHLRIPPEITRLAKLQHPVTNDLSDGLDRLEARLQEHPFRTADTD